MTEWGLTALIEEDGPRKVVLTDGGREAYRRLVVWVNEVVHRRR